MKRVHAKWLLAPLLALVVTMGACAEQGTDLLLGPSGQASESLSLAQDIQSILKGEAPDLSARTNSAIIGPEGGVLYVDLHHLYVPRGAVSGRTRFVMTLNDDRSIGARLTATSVDAAGNPTGPVNNVGSSGFAERGVYLTFSFAYASNVPSNTSLIRIVHVKDGQYYPQPTTVNTVFRTATGRLGHFSDFALAWP